MKNYELFKISNITAGSETKLHSVKPSYDETSYIYRKYFCKNTLINFE